VKRLWSYSGSCCHRTAWQEPTTTFRTALLVNVQEHFIYYCRCEVVMLFRFLLSPYSLTDTYNNVYRLEEGGCKCIYYKGQQCDKVWEPLLYQICSHFVNTCWNQKKLLCLATLRHKLQHFPDLPRAGSCVWGVGGRSGGGIAWPNAANVFQPSSKRVSVTTGTWRGAYSYHKMWLLACTPYSLTLKMEAVYTSETLVNLYGTKRRNNPGESFLNKTAFCVQNVFMCFAWFSQ
jgi:hypothetical protein